MGFVVVVVVVSWFIREVEGVSSRSYLTRRGQWTRNGWPSPEVDHPIDLESSSTDLETPRVT